MGSGCSSPLRRLGGKRGKPARRESSPFEANGDSDNQDQYTIACRQQQEQPQQSSGHQHKFILENETTVQSEINEDHPSTASYYTDVKNHNEETKLSEHSASLDPKSYTGLGSSDPTSSLTGGGGLNMASKMMGLNGSYAPHDRHLLVSPALSPAPSTCYSPSPANSTIGCAPLLDLNDLNEAFKTLTFGLPDFQANQRIKQPERQQSELHNYYTQQLVQSQDDLINYISVIFITTDTFQFTSTTTTNPDNNSKQQHELPTAENIDLNIEILANHIESNLKSFCDEHLFNLRFLDLSHTHLSEHFHINNLLDTSMRILEQEYRENSQRIIIVVLSNNINGISSSSGGSTTSSTTETTTPTNVGGGGKSNQQLLLDKIQLPTKIEAQSMNKLQRSNTITNLDTNAKDLLKRWYNQVGNIFYLNPIYLVYPKISSESKEERDEAWQSWLSESNVMINAIKLVQENDLELVSEIKLKSLFGYYIEFIMNEPALQKRTLLIRNYSQPMNTSILSNHHHQQQQQQQQQPQQSASLNQNKEHGNLYELARLLADPNKLTLKRSMNEEEFSKTVTEWINENFNKFVKGILENQIIYGKHMPPFIERNLFIELTRQRHYLEHYLDNVTENYEAKCLAFYTSQILPILNGVVSGNNNTNTLQPDPEAASVTIDQQQSSSISAQPSANHLVFISGPKGCGKSTLFAQIIKLTAQDLFNKTQIIYRFCGLTLDSLSPNRLLRSICEQFCQTQGENITAASYIYSARREIMNALNKIINLQTSLIFLDGLDLFRQSSSGDQSDLDWLCEIEANPRIKIFIMLETDSELYKKVLCTYTDATYISIDNPSISEWAQMLTSTARSRRFISAGNLYDEIKQNLNVTDSTDATSLTYSDVNDIINACRIRQLNSESIYPELTAKIIQNNDPIQNLKKVQRVVLSHLQYLMTPYQLCALFVTLDSSRNGLAESDIINIMTMISQSAETKSSSTSNAIRFSSALLKYVKIQLQPWLIYIVCDKTVKLSVQRDFLTKAIEHYVPIIYPNIINEVREVLLDYFNRQTRSKPNTRSVNLIKSVVESSSNIELKDSGAVSLSESLWLATQASEIANLLILTNPSKAKDHVMNKNQFFSQFFYGSMPEEFIEDFERLKDLIGKKANDELQCLVNYIRQSIYPLRYDGSQIYSQIYCRAYETIKTGKFSKSKKFNDILSIASCPPMRNLLPISEASVNSFIKTRIGHSNNNNNQTTNTSNAPTETSGATTTPSSSANSQKLAKSSIYSGSQSGQAQAKQRIYTIKDNHRHIIVIYPDKGTLSVWDIYEERAVRTINNLDQPRDLKMIDQKRAVILCNRELRVYDLDSGNMLTKLKGVMNQKMPFFEVFGENYVVALARNRMYVNMLNLNTGELETTFKVGEDRFLNSLLVSADGGICVCGDETQKPFPLLVWNLNERRLLYDLRLDRHEFITRMSAISDDGHFVVSVCKQLGDADVLPHGPNNSSSSSSSAGAHKSSPNFIVIYDLNSGTLFKKWKPGLDSCSVAISLSANRSGKVINTVVDSSILVWDLATDSKRHTLIGHSAPADVIKVQNNRLFSMDSTCRDQSLRIWDIEEGYCLAVFSPDAPVNCCQISVRGDALVCGFAAETRLSTLVVCKNETVNDIIKQNKRRKSSKSIYLFDEPPSRKSSS